MWQRVGMVVFSGFAILAARLQKTQAKFNSKKCAENIVFAGGSWFLRTLRGRCRFPDSHHSDYSHHSDLSMVFTMWRWGLGVGWGVWGVFGGYTRFSGDTKRFDTIESEESAVCG